MNHWLISSTKNRNLVGSRCGAGAGTYEGDADAEGADGAVLLGPPAAAVGRHVAPHRGAPAPSAMPLAGAGRGQRPARAVRGLEHRRRAALPVHGEARRRLGRAARGRREEREEEEEEAMDGQGHQRVAAGEGGRRG
jgi:hypothetical protein